MKRTKLTRSLLLALSLTMAVNTTNSMESTPPSGITSWISENPLPAGIALIGSILLGIAALKTLWQQPEAFPFSDLPSDMQNTIIGLIITGATGDTFNETASAINTLAQINKELNTLINDKNFSYELINNLANRFNMSRIDVAHYLNTKTAKQIYRDEVGPNKIIRISDTAQRINQRIDLQGNTLLLDTLHSYKPYETDTKYIINILQKGANPELANFEGLTPLQAAIDTGDHEVIKIIQDAINKKHGM